MHRHIYVCTAVALTLLLGLGASRVIADDASDRQAIESAAQQWAKAFNDRNAAALTAVSTDDVVVLDGGVQPIHGPSQASESWRRASALTRGGIKTASKEIVISGATAWRVASVAYQRSGGQWHKGQSLEIWQRSPTGWKLHRQMSSHLFQHTLRPSPSEPVLGTPTN